MRKRFPRAEYDIVLIGASYGGSEVLRPLLSILPESFPSAIVIVQYVSAAAPTYLPEILRRTSRLPVESATADQPVEGARVYVAPPGHRLRFGGDGRFKLSLRTALDDTLVDPLFTSAARVYRSRALGVILTGRMLDGSGTSEIRRAGGAVIAQSPDTCLAPSMSRSAIAAGADFVVDPSQLAAALISLVMVEGVAAMFGVGPHRN